MPPSPVKSALRVLAITVGLLLLLGVAAVAGGSYLFGSKFGSLPQLSKEALKGDPEPQADAGRRRVYLNATKSGPLPTPEPPPSP